MGTNDDIAKRLRDERVRVGLSQERFAEKGGVGRKTQGLYESGERVPDAHYLAEVASLGVDVGYVIDGNRRLSASAVHPEVFLPPSLHRVGEEAPPPYAQIPNTHVGDSRRQLLPALLSRAEVSDVRPLALALPSATGERTREYLVIPRYMASAHAGSGGGGRQVDGTDQAVADAAGVIAFERTFMRAELGRDGSGFVTVTVEGDSMERTLSDGETIVVDTVVDRVTASGIYVLAIGEDLIVKRIVRKLDGSLVVKSDNPIYSDSDELFSPETIHRIQVLGRMVWPKVR